MIRRTTPTQRSISTIVAISAMCIALAGCRLSGYHLSYPANPVDGVTKIAVAPVLGPSGTDPFATGDAIAAELVQCSNVERVVRPAEFQRALETSGVTLNSESAVEAVAKALDVDGVLVAEVTEYSPYHPPRIGIIAQLFITRSSSSTAPKVVDISRTGRAGPIARLDAGNVVQIERIYDAANREINSRASHYAFGHNHDSEAIAGGERVLWVQKLYFQFVSYSLVKDIFEEYSTQQERNTTTTSSGSTQRDGHSRLVTSGDTKSLK